MDGSKIKLPVLTLMVLISFGSVSAVLFTPALPAIASFFAVSADTAHQLMLWFLVPYTFGQLAYGPLANRFGRKPVIYAGILVQVFSSFLCVFSGYVHAYWLLIIGRFFSGLGSGVGLKMTFTIVADMVDPLKVSRQLSYITISLALVPGLAAAVGGFATSYWGWASTFYIVLLYGIMLMLLIVKIPETHKIINENALKLSQLIHGYSAQFRNRHLVGGALIMSGSPSFFFIFSTLGPFVAIDHFKMSSKEYGMWNLLPALGLLLASLISAKLSDRYERRFIIKCGIFAASLGALLMLLLMLLKIPAIFSLFIPAAMVYFGSMLTFPSVSAFAMKGVDDKANASAVINFIFMAVPTGLVFSFLFLPHGLLLMPVVYLLICGMMLTLFKTSLMT